MMKVLIKNATLVNEEKKTKGSILIEDGLIVKISDKHIDIKPGEDIQAIDAEGKVAIPGVIDDQVHFREPGLTHKGNIYSESKAAVAGGITSFMEMPNTNPQTTTQELLEQKFELGQKSSLANFSFYLGATNENLAEVSKTDPKNVCGVKVFMGASTGNMLVDNKKTLQGIFAESPCLVATHCEDEQTIQKNLQKYLNKYGQEIKPEHHPLIRSEEACYRSSSQAVELASKYNTQLHVLHLSTAKELSLFEKGKIRDKKITGEVCVHHLWFDANDYLTLGHKIKWNPAVKAPENKEALMQGLLEDKLDVVATDHAPHLLDEKLNKYTQSASGGPLVQHSLLTMLQLYHQKKISLEKIVFKMCHAPADLFRVNKRGYLREGYFADIVLIDLNKLTTVDSNNILYKCGWSPFEGVTFNSSITHTFVNGQLVYHNGHVDESIRGRRLTFNR